VYAGQLVPGDRLVRGTDGAGLEEVELVGVEERAEEGYWAPLTTEGTLLVDGYLASCYASYPHVASDLALAPVKAHPRLLLDDEASQHKDGVRSVVKMLKDLGNHIGLRRKEHEERAGLEHVEERLGQAGAMQGMVGTGKHGEL
jgi:hypothetical protein